MTNLGALVCNKYIYINMKERDTYLLLISLGLHKVHLVSHDARTDNENSRLA